MPTPAKYPAPVTSISTCPFSCATGHFVGGGGGTAVTIRRITAVQSATTLPKLFTRMELLRVELNRDELEEKSIREHLGVLYVKGGYTLKEGTSVCLVLQRVAVEELCAHASRQAWPGKLSHATTKAVTVVWNQTPNAFLSLSKPVPGPPCLEPDNNSPMRPVKA